MQNNLLYIIGISSHGITAEKKAVLTNCRSIFCAEKYREALKTIPATADNPVDLLPITPIAELEDTIQKKLAEGNVAVIASGDPLFYGIGKKLTARFGTASTRVYPDLSYIQIAFSRFQMNWDDAEIISLHGREHKAISRSGDTDKRCFLTDHKNTPHSIARYLKNRADSSEYTLYVAENLCSDEEYLFNGTLDQILEHRIFSCPNIVIAVRRKNTAQRSPATAFGLREEQIQHSRGLITKNEVRSVCIHTLALPLEGVLWDVGGGSGSVSIESAGIAPRLDIFCVEKKEEEQNNILHNCRLFERENIELVQGEAPEALKKLPAPDRVFIGGSGGNLEQIIEYCCARLKKGGKIVINCILRSSAEFAPELLYKNGLEVEINQVAVQRITYPDFEKKSLNPITIVSGSLAL